jgi:ribose 5-phosphate isomerase B
MHQIYIASDPWASDLHRHLRIHLAECGHNVTDLVDPIDESVPYYEAARRVAVAVANAGGSRGLVLCGTGMGVAMVANAFPGTWCALCDNTLSAHRARAFNDANVLAMGALFTTPYVAEQIVNVFLNTPFGDGVDAARAEEIANWRREVRRMKRRICHEDWKRRSVPESVPEIRTEVEDA